MCVRVYVPAHVHVSVYTASYTHIRYICVYILVFGMDMCKGAGLLAYHIIVEQNICVYTCTCVMLTYHLHTIFWRIHLYIRYMGLHTNILSVYIGVASLLAAVVETCLRERQLQSEGGQLEHERQEDEGAS